jgi:hypothetical protein
VDVVYSWVQGADPKFAAKVLQATGKPPDCHRVVSSGEIFMALTALCHFAPWVHHVYIVVDEQSFALDFLPSSCRRHVSFVDLSAFIPEQYLPTFNSHVIEAHLHLIPELQEHFLYFNDDMILARPLRKEQLFSSHGLFKAQLQPPTPGYQRWLHEGTVEEEQPWKHPRRNAALLFLSMFQDAEPPGRDLHGPAALTRSSLDTTWQLFGPQLRKAVTNMLRVYAPLEEGGDVHVTMLAQRVGVETRTLHMSDYLQVVTLNKSATLETVAADMFTAAKDVVCLQGLRHMPFLDLHALCWLVRQQWCSGDRVTCQRLLRYCRVKAGCGPRRRTQRAKRTRRQRSKVSKPRCSATDCQKQ